MRQSLKISLSLLIALVLFAAFSVLAFRGGFDYLQAAFFQPQVLRERGQALEEAAAAVRRYHERNVERFRAALQEPFIAGAFSATGQQSREDIFNRGNLFGKLLEEYPNLQGVRFLDADGERVHFSTFPQDATYGADRRSVTYLDFSKAEPSLKAGLLLARAAEEPRLLVDGRGGRLLYSFPVEARGSYRGAAVFFLSASDLQAALLREPGSSARGLLLVDRLGVLVSFPEGAGELLLSSVASSWNSRPRPAEGQDTLQFEGPQGASRHLLLSRSAGRFGLVGWLVPYSQVELQPLLKIILLAAVLLTVFLVVFLVFNIRQDQQLVLVRRIKRFQLDVLAELIEGKERLDWQRWRDQLTANRAELRSRFKQGMGRIPSGKETEVDGLIDRGWDEIIGIIEARLGERGREKVAISQIEEMIQKALDRGRFTVAGTLPAGAPSLPAETQPKRRKDLVVEEIGVEEVSELADAGPAAERQPEAAAAEEVEEAEPVEEELAAEEAEAVEEVPAAEEAGRRREPAFAAEVEEAEAAEEVEEAEAVEEEPAVEEAGRQPAIAEEVEEAEAVEEEPAAEEAEAVEAAAEAVVEPASRPAPAAPTIAGIEDIIEEIVEEVGPASAGGTAAPVEAPAEPLTPAAAEAALEELEIVGEIVALPPEPQEKLEELPQLEEPAPAAKERVFAERPMESQEALENLEALEEVTEEEAEEPAAELESAEAEPRTIQELLESPEELEIQEPAVASPADELALLDRLVAQGVLRPVSLTEFEAQVQEIRTSVVMENGVYRVKEEVRRAKAPAAAGMAGGRGLMALAEAARSSGGEEESGIGELLGSGSGVDLSDELGTPTARGKFPSYAELRRGKRLGFSSSGLDFDQYLLHFRVGASETGSLKSLVEISRKLKAVSAALLIKTGDSFVSRLRIGLLEKPARILLSAGEPFYDRFLSQRQAVLLYERPQAIPSLAARFNPEDLKYMRQALFLPAVYQKTDAVLFFGLPSSKPLELKEIIQALDIYP